MRIVHLSDIHVWRYTRDPRRLANKRLWGVVQLAAGRARKFRLDRLAGVVERVRGLAPDHVLITGDLTTTALPEEFTDAFEALSPLLDDPGRATVLPGNHDRYTRREARSGAFEAVFGRFAPGPLFPWLRRLDGRTGIVGLDASRPHYSARGYLPPSQLDHARALAEGLGRPIIACHYPIDAPEPYRAELHAKRLENAEVLRSWLRALGPHLYCCGHVHARWAYRPPGLPDQLALNAGAPLLRDSTGLRPPGFLEIRLDGPSVLVDHHGWIDGSWEVRTLADEPTFFEARRG